MRAFVLPLVAAFSPLLSSCSDGAASMLPVSGGRPYEVLIVSNDKAAGQVVDSVLSHDAVCLPQPEPEFDTSLTDSAHLNGMTRMARNIVVVTVDKTIFSKTRVRYDKDVWARRQMVVYVNAPDAVTLKRDLTVLGGRLVGLLARSETNRAIRGFAASPNPQADSMVKAVTGRRSNIPSSMSSSKTARGFVWLSDNDDKGMTSFCAYTYAGLDQGIERFRQARDSVMKANIPGERDGMCMVTAPLELKCAMERVRQRETMIIRGLWEMNGDAMGGPFAAHVTVDSTHRRMVVVEAFVYAPGRKKRNLIRQAEAMLYEVE